MLLTTRRLDHRRVQRIHQRLHLRFQAAAHELVGVIDDEADVRRVLARDAARILRRNDDGGIHFAGAHIFARLLLVVIRNGRECARCSPRRRRMPRAFSRPAAADRSPLRRPARLATLPPKALPRMIELHERQHHRHHHQRRASERTSASRARQLPTFGSWLHPRARRHHEADGLHLLVAKLPTRVMNEYVVKCRVLHAQRV